SDFHQRFPTVTAHAMSVGLDPVDDLLPVAPAAHFFMGGIDVDLRGRTSVDGLWAVGECSASGGHGANRLASNSLLEGLVYGARGAADVSVGRGAPAGELRTPTDSLDRPVMVGPSRPDLRKILWERPALIWTGTGLRE